MKCYGLQIPAGNPSSFCCACIHQGRGRLTWAMQMTGTMIAGHILSILSAAWLSAYGLDVHLQLLCELRCCKVLCDCV